MMRRIAGIALGMLLIAGVAHAGKGVAPAAYHGKDKQQAAEALLQGALAQAGDGTWERIAVGRVYYLAGSKAQGQAIFDQVLSGRADGSDLMRVARVYCEAGEWPRAKVLFDKALAMEPEEQTWKAEVGAYYLLNDDRDGAEALFDRSLRKDEVWATVAAAGAYLGLAPQP